MKLKKIIRHPKRIEYTKTQKGRGEEDEEHTCKTDDAPLEEFTSALKKLGPICAKLMQLGPDWKGETYCTGVEDIKHAGSGARSVVLVFGRKFPHFKAAWHSKTPSFPIDDIENSVSTKNPFPNITEEEAQQIKDFIEQGELYVDGNRVTQGKLTLTDENGAPELALDGDLPTEEVFNRAIHDCTHKKALCELVQKYLEQDWAGVDMKLPDMKKKAVGLFKDLVNA